MTHPRGPIDLLERPAQGTPVGALILLHGRGTTEHDLHPLLNTLDPAGMLVGVTPGGPLALAPGGRHWYVVPRVGYPDPSTFAQTHTDLGGVLDGWLASHGLDWSRTIVGGFSQGAVMSYAMGLGPGRPSPAGILALSGFIPTVDGWSAALEGRAGLPVLITHGRRDPIMDVAFARTAAQTLSDGGLDVQYLESDAAHQIDPAHREEIEAWVSDRIAGM